MIVLLQTGVSHIHFTKLLLRASSPIIPQSHHNFNTLFQQSFGRFSIPLNRKQIGNIVLLDFGEAFQSILEKAFNGDIRVRLRSSLGSFSSPYSSELWKSVTSSNVT